MQVQKLGPRARLEVVRCIFFIFGNYLSSRYRGKQWSTRAYAVRVRVTYPYTENGYLMSLSYESLPGAVYAKQHEVSVVCLLNILLKYTTSTKYYRICTRQQIALTWGNRGEPVLWSYGACRNF